MHVGRCEIAEMQPQKARLVLVCSKDHEMSESLYSRSLTLAWKNRADLSLRTITKRSHLCVRFIVTHPTSLVATPNLQDVAWLCLHWLFWKIWKIWNWMEMSGIFSISVLRSSFSKGICDVPFITSDVRLQFHNGRHQCYYALFLGRYPPLYVY